MSADVDVAITAPEAVQDRLPPVEDLQAQLGRQVWSEGGGARVEHKLPAIAVFPEAGGRRSPGPSAPVTRHANSVITTRLGNGLGNSQSFESPPRISSQCASASRAGSVISNGTGRPVFCWTIVERCRTTPAWATSAILSLTRSQPLSLASRATLNIARSRTAPTDLKCWRMAQICFGFSGALAPVMRPAFQGLRGVRNRSGWPRATSYDQGPMPTLHPAGRLCARS